MPKDPKGRKRPADIASNAVKVMRIATGEDDDKDKRRAEKQGDSENQ